MNAVVGPLATGVLALVSVLAGALLTGRLNARIARATRAAADRSDAIAAVATLAAALAAHRAAMWYREDLRLRGGDGYDQARAASHETRAAITAPLTVVAIRVPRLAHLAARAAQATYDLRDAPDGRTLADLRQQALRASDALVTAAGRALGASTEAVAS